MKKTQSLISIYLLVISVFITAATILRTIAFLNDYNYHTGYFNDQTLLGVANWLILIGCIFSASALLMHSEMPKFKPNFQSPLVYIPAGAVSVALAFLAGSKAYMAFTLNGMNTTSQTLAGDRIFLFVIAVFALVSIAYFMFSHIEEHHRSPERGALGLVLTVFFALCAAQTYFAQNTPINSQIKSVDQIAFAFVAIFFLFESRLSLDRDIWSGYIAFGGIAASLAAYSAIPSIIYYFVNARESSSLSESILFLTVFALIITRLLLLFKLPEDKMCETAEATLLMARTRHAEIEAAKNIRAHAILDKVETVEEPTVDDSADDNYTINLDQIDITNIENGDI